MEEKSYIAIDLKSFFASVECVERDLDPLNTNLVVADAGRTEKTICLAVSPSLKTYGIPGRARLFEVVQKVKEMTGGEVLLSPGTMYGSLSKMEKDGVISFVREEEKRKIYVITQLGREILELERKRIERLHRNAEEEMER